MVLEGNDQLLGHAATSGGELKSDAAKPGDGQGVTIDQAATGKATIDTLDRFVLAMMVVLAGIVIVMAAFGLLSSAYLFKSLVGVDLFPGPSPLHALYAAFL